MELSKLFSARRAAIRPEHKIERPRGEDGALPWWRFPCAKGQFTKSICLSVPLGYVSCSVTVLVQVHPGRHLY